MLMGFQLHVPVSMHTIKRRSATLHASLQTISSQRVLNTIVNGSLLTLNFYSGLLSTSSYAHVMLLRNKTSLQNLFNANVSPVGRLPFKLAVLAATHFTVAVTPVQL